MGGSGAVFKIIKLIFTLFGSNPGPPVCESGEANHYTIALDIANGEIQLSLIYKFL